MLKKPIDVKEGTPIALVVQEDVLTPPAEMGMDIDADGKLFVVYKGADGAIYLAASNPERKDWISHERIFYVPSGASRPNIALSHGKPLVVAELVSAGTEQKEIWLYEPPYSGTGIRQITQGQYPVLARDVHGEIFLFYQTADMSQILYRKSSDNFTIDYTFESSEDEELQPRGFRALIEQISPIHQRYTHLMFYQEGEGELPLYKMTRPIDLVKIKQTAPLYTNFGQPSLEWEGIKYVDLFAKAGALVSFGELGLEWEEMRTGMQVLVYSEKQIIYEQTHLLRHYNTGTRQRDALVWQEKGQSADQDVTVDIYAGDAKRPGIILRVDGSNGAETGYAGYYRYPDNYLEIHRYLNGVSQSMATKVMPADQDKWYTLRMQAIGNNLKLKIWEKGAEEPSTWDIETTDSAIASGYAGVFDFDANGTSYWANYSLNDDPADFSELSGGIPAGWALQFGTASRWTTETESIAVGVEYVPVPDATMQLGEEISQTNQEGLAEFYDLQANELYDYTISHPDFEGVSKGTILIPEEERDFIPVRIYDNPWDGFAKGRGVQPSLGNISTLWHQVEFEEIKARASGVHANMGLQSILWVEVES